MVKNERARLIEQLNVKLLWYKPGHATEQIRSLKKALAGHSMSVDEVASSGQPATINVI